MIGNSPHHCVSNAFQLLHQFKASSGSILASEVLSIKEGSGLYLATAGHGDSGTVRLWPLQSILQADHNSNEEEGFSSSSLDAHQGSIFTLSCVRQNDDLFVATGSFDRAAKLYQLTTDDEGMITEPLLRGILPEHTGWVRQVEAILPLQSQNNNLPVVLSIGCEYINAWTTATTNEASSVRIARLDAGPSPDDHEEFRRHDILCFAVVGETPAAVAIVAGLVDGTLRVFEANLNVWMERYNNSPYDATGSCGCADDGVVDDRPRNAVNAHGGRITSVVPSAACKDTFVTASHDGRWIRWRLEEDFSLTQIVDGYIPLDDDGRRITCAECVDDDTLFLGTNTGCYKACLMKGGESERLWKSDDGSKISSISSTTTSISDEEANLLILCTSSGDALVFGE